MQFFDELGANPTGKEIGDAARNVIARLELAADYGKLETMGISPQSLLDIAENMDLEMSIHGTMNADTFDYYRQELYDWGDSARVIIGDDRYKKDQLKPRLTSQRVFGAC